MAKHIGCECRHPDLKIIVVNDGSSDNTAEKMISEFNMIETYLVRDTETISHKPIRKIYRSHIYPSLLFIDKENGKKADAINVGLTCVRTPLFCVIDAQTINYPNHFSPAFRSLSIFAPF